MRSRTSLISTLLRTRHDPNQILFKLALREALGGCESVLDVGCGVSPTMRQLGVPQSCGAEGYPPSFQEAKRQNTHDQLVQCDVRELSKHFQPRQFDACIALDVIEHLTKAMTICRSIFPAGRQRRWNGWGIALLASLGLRICADLTMC